MGHATAPQLGMFIEPYILVGNVRLNPTFVAGKTILNPPFGEATGNISIKVLASYPLVNMAGKCAKTHVLSTGG